MSTGQDLLPSDALTGIRLGISVSKSQDLLRLGLREIHFRLALAEIARCILISGGNLAYGGHLRSDGYTSFLIQELERYSRRDRPLRVCLAWVEHQQLPSNEVADAKNRLGLYGEILCLDPDGNVIAVTVERSDAPMRSPDGVMQKRSLTGLRRYMTSNTDGRVFIGGKRQDFQGDMPGILEEALFAFEKGQPIYLAGGFGGMTWDIARALGIGEGTWLPVLPDQPAPDERVVSGMSRLTEALRATGGQSLKNGLTKEENQRLAACYRPSEIAALVSLGLGRKFRKDKTN